MPSSSSEPADDASVDPPTVDPPTTESGQLSAQQLASVADALEQIAQDRSLLAQLSNDERQRLLRYASQVALPDRNSRRRLRKAFHQQKQQEQEALRQQDEQALAQTGIRRQYSVRQLKKAEPPAPPDQLPPQLESDANAAAPSDPPELKLDRCCYTCKARYRQLHHFYDALCPACAELNWTKRLQTADLSGRYAIVTGGRVKIGYQAALKLLRAGAHTIVTTRFPRDATRRFLEEPDHADWSDRLEVFGLDLRHTPSVEALASHLVATQPRLDFILNNACQTVRRPPGFYAHLMADEEALAEALPHAARQMLDSYETLRADRQSRDGLPTELAQGRDSTDAGIRQAAALSQIPLAPGDEHGGEHLFPTGLYDHDQQQVDLREINSWRLRLAEVPTVELLEVQLVNAVAPFILNARLKPLMTRVPSRDKHIVNVSAMEGVFYRAYKTDKHPHTNMAKAALNMLTRTSAQDYAADGIHMNSVDTGWITDEDPAEIAKRKQQELGFHPPLDIVDAAARICDPIFSGLLTGKHVWGKFLKDYQVASW